MPRSIVTDLLPLLDRLELSVEECLEVCLHLLQGARASSARRSVPRSTPVKQQPRIEPRPAVIDVRPEPVALELKPPEPVPVVLPPTPGGRLRTFEEAFQPGEVFTKKEVVARGVASTPGSADVRVCAATKVGILERVERGCYRLRSQSMAPARPESGSETSQGQ